MNKIETRPMPSGVLYNRRTGLMVLDFTGRGKQPYDEVPPSVYDALRKSPSEAHFRFVDAGGHQLSLLETPLPGDIRH